MRGRIKVWRHNGILYLPLLLGNLMLHNNWGLGRQICLVSPLDFHLYWSNLLLRRSTRSFCTGKLRYRGDHDSLLPLLSLLELQELSWSYFSQLQPMSSRSSLCMYRMYGLCRAMYNLVQVSRRIVTDRLLVSRNTCRSLLVVLRTHWYKFYTGMLICTKLEVQQEFLTIIKPAGKNLECHKNQPVRTSELEVLAK